MLKNYVKIAFRNLKNSRGFTAINIVGLAIGMAAAMLIMLWVNFQLGFNKNFSKTEQLYMVGSKGKADDKIAVWFATPKPLAPVLKSDIAEAKNVTRLSGTNGYLFDLGDKKVPAGVGAFVDSAFLKMFDYELIAGNRDDALKGPQNIVLTDELAKNLFGTVNAVGKTIRIDSTNSLNVSAVINVESPNHIFAGYEYYMPWTLMEKLGYSDNQWNNSSVDLYVELEENANIDKIQKQISDIMPRYSDNETEAFLKPYGDLYLYNKYENGVLVGGRVDMVNTFTIVAVLILLIACINFMNLCTAQSEKRAKEVGIRKVVGARKKSIIFQFLSESLILSTISGILALIIVSLTLSSFNDLVGFKFNIPTHDIRFWGLFGGFIILTSFMAGIYPAFFLSSFNPIKVLKGRFGTINQKINPRKILVVSQFTIAIILIVSTIVIQKQIKYAQDRDFGFQKENLIYVNEVGDIAKNSNLIKQELLEQGIAQSVSRFLSPITERWSGCSCISWQNKDPNEDVSFNRQTGDDKVIETAGFELVAGRDFDLSKFPTDSTAALINETAASRMKFRDPIGQYFDDSGRKYQIIGVIKDFIQESPFEPVKPLVIEGARGRMFNTHIRFNPKLSTEEALSKAAKIFKKFNPDYPFDYKFVDEAYAKKFAESQKTGKFATIFAGLTIFISCLGLFGLAAYMAESRTKEIGIRKVLGASVFTVTRMLSTEFIVLILISCLVSFPISYWVMNKFLSDYSYRISINYEIFLIAGAGAIAVTLLTVSYQSIKAAMANPVDSLRDE